jgi:hypothetical protein
VADGPNCGAGRLVVVLALSGYKDRSFISALTPNKGQVLLEKMQIEPHISNRLDNSLACVEVRSRCAT